MDIEDYLKTSEQYNIRDRQFIAVNVKDLQAWKAERDALQNSRAILSWLDNSAEKMSVSVYRPTGEYRSAKWKYRKDGDLLPWVEARMREEK